MTITLEVTAQPTPADLAFVGDSLGAFNEGDVGPAQRTPIAVFARNADGAIIAGLSGYTAWGWLYIQWLWVHEKARGQRLAARLLGAAETEGRVRGCHAAYIDTFNPIALGVYTGQGYSEFGRLDDFPEGRARFFLQKKL